MDDLLLAAGILAVTLGLPGLIWYLIIRRIIRGRRAEREVRMLAATLTQRQAEEFDRTLLPQASDIHEQRELLVQYLGSLEGDQP